MTEYLFPPPAPVAVPIRDSDQRFPVHRVFCVGRNYAAHVREMGFDPDREPPCYFTKSSSAIVVSGDKSGATIPYPPGTSDLHHEIELVAAIGRTGFRIAVEDALEHVYGYACGLDMTRRDLQVTSREQKGPWDVGKDFDNAAIIGAIAPAASVGHPDKGRIGLAVNGEIRQDADIAGLIWSVAEIVADLSRFYRLVPGDLIYTGTPAGVGPVEPGDRLVGSIDGVGEIWLTIEPAVT